MSRKKLNYYSLWILSLLMICTVSPAFGEVTHLQVNTESFYKGD